jgi:Family of unknown function (DUF5677)
MDHFELLKRLVDEIIERTQQINFNAADRYDLYAVMLYASIIEFSKGICTLIEAGEPTGTRTLTRTALEALVDLSILVDDREYVHHLDAKSLKEWLKTYEAAEDGNEFFAKIAEVPKLREQIDREQAQLADLIENGFRPLNVYQRFERAGMEELYQTIYAWLCSDSHNSFRGLIDRHIDISENGEVSLHILKASNIEDHLHIIDTLCGFLISASQLIHLHFGAGRDVIDDLEAEVTQVRERWHRENDAPPAP